MAGRTGCKIPVEIGGRSFPNIGKWGSVRLVRDVVTSQHRGLEGARSVSLRIPAKAEYITLCRLALTGLGQVRAISEDTMADLKLALTEAVSNSVRHAYGPNGEGSVDVRYELHPDRLGIEVVDDGEGFDPEREEAQQG